MLPYLTFLYPLQKLISVEIKKVAVYGELKGEMDVACFKVLSCHLP